MTLTMAMFSQEQSLWCTDHDTKDYCDMDYNDFDDDNYHCDYDDGEPAYDDYEGWNDDYYDIISW